ncbi:MAG: DpnII family type II restriction endonuclease [Gammaproteobacteria bacterium]
MTNAPVKITFAELTASMRVFLDFPAVEDAVRGEIRKIIGKIMLSKAQNGGRPPVDVLTDYLNAGQDAEMRLKFIIGFAGGSLEKVKRVYEALFPGKPWNEIKHNEKVRRRIAAFLVAPQAEQTYIPRFIGESFFLPANWIQLLQDGEYLQAVARNILQSKYAVGMGVALEECIRAAVADCGYESDKGAVAIVDDKEVDIAVPNLNKPRILIMSSYLLTTASSQTSKAHEQARMYQDVQTHNRRRRQRDRSEILFVNVVDGGGWLARQRDLHRMWQECDYCFSLAKLNDFKQVLAHYLKD